MTSRIDAVLDGVLNHPLHRGCDMELVDAANGRSTLRFQVNDFASNPQGVLHGGITYAMIDVACFFAVVNQMPAHQHPVSVETHVSILRPALKGETVTIEAWVDRLGKSLAAMRAEVFAGEGDARRLIASGNVTKAVLSDRGF